MLLGDAAHTMTPVTGQGCNSGLEDAHIFANVLREEDDLDKALPRYNEKRLPDVAALVRLNEILAFGRFGVVVIYLYLVTCPSLAYSNASCLLKITIMHFSWMTSAGSHAISA